MRPFVGAVVIKSMADLINLGLGLQELFVDEFRRIWVKVRVSIWIVTLAALCPWLGILHISLVRSHRYGVVLLAAYFRLNI